MKQGHLFIIFGPSGVGKSTVIKSLLSTNQNFVQIPSCTTRPIRSDDLETNARIHLTKDEFQKLISDNALVDWVEYSGHFYGKKKQDITSALEEGKIIILDVEYHGVPIYKQTFPESTIIFMQYASLEDLKTRLRKARPDCPEEEISRRYQIAQEEMANIPSYDYTITTYNDQSPKVPAQKLLETINSVLANQPSEQV